MPGARKPREDPFESFVSLYRGKFKYSDILLGDRGDPSFRRELIDRIKKSIMGRMRDPRGMDPLELDFMLEYVVSGMIGVMRHYFHAHPRKNPSELMAMLHRSMSGDFLRRLRGIMA